MRTGPTKVLFVEPASDLAGVSQYILKIARHIGKEFRLYFAGPSGGQLLNDIDFAKRVEFFSLSQNYKTLGGINAEAKDLRKIIADNSIDILHAHTLRAAFLCAYAARGRHFVKFIYTPHGFRFTQLRNGAKKLGVFLIDYFVCACADRVVVLSQSEKNDAIRFHLPHAKTYAIIPTSIDAPAASQNIERPADIPSDAFVVGMIGRIAPQKDPFGFLQAAIIIKKTVSKAFFVWIGDGELKDELERKIKEAGLQDSFLIMGQVSHDKVLAAPFYIDTILFTSWYEGLPIVLLEMLSVGIPVVAAQVGSIPDVIKNGSTGWLFQPGDYEIAAELVTNTSHLSSQDVLRMKSQQRTLVAEKYIPESREAMEYEKLYYFPQ